MPVFHRRLRPAALLLLALPAAAHAADSGLYVTIGAGQTSADGEAHADTNAFFNTLPPGTVSINNVPFDADGTTFFGSAGYRINRYFAVELGYADLGELDSLTLTRTGEYITLTVESLTAGVRFSFPLVSSWTAHWRAAISRAQYDVAGQVTIVTPVDPAVLSFASPEDENGWVWGLGFSRQLGDSLSAGVEYSQYKISVIDVESVGLVLRWNF